ncbi:hypothetical protein PMX27_24785, partial [Enterocloster clostridioformis]
MRIHKSFLVNVIHIY